LVYRRLGASAAGAEVGRADSALSAIQRGALLRRPGPRVQPQHIGGVPSTFCWSPVEGCQDPATAIRRADAFAFAVSQKGVEDGTFWSAKASDYLRGYFHAAALGQYDLRAVAAWVSGADPDVPERILAAAGAHQWALTLAELQSEAHKTAATVRTVMSRAGRLASPGSIGRSNAFFEGGWRCTCDRIRLLGFGFWPR
jgi:hypothetical protein